MSVSLERYAHALALFALGVALLGHGMAATAFVEGVAPATVALPLVGSALAYWSLVGLLPPESSLTDDGFVALLAVLTAGVVNVAVPLLYRAANVSSGAVARPTYWHGLVAGLAGFAAMGVYELLADRARSPHALAKLLGAALAATAVAVGLLVAPARPPALAPSEAASVVVGAVLATALSDYPTRAKDERTVEDASAGATQ